MGLNISGGKIFYPSPYNTTIKKFHIFIPDRKRELCQAALQDKSRAWKGEFRMGIALFPRQVLECCLRTWALGRATPSLALKIWCFDCCQQLWATSCCPFLVCAGVAIARCFIRSSAYCSSSKQWSYIYPIPSHY